MTNALSLLAEATLIFLVAWLLSGLTRSWSAAQRHLMWLSALTSALLLWLRFFLPILPVQVPELVVVSAFDQPGSVLSGSPTSAGFAVLGLWAAGSLLCLARCIGSMVVLLRKLRGLTAIGLHGQTPILEGPETLGPAAWALGSSSFIILPASAQSWPHNQRQAILLHEAAHLHRRESWSYLVAELACALYWFHPLAWFAAARLRHEAERAADDGVLAAGVEPHFYGLCLTAVARSQVLPWLAGAGQPSQLENRILSILNPERNRTAVNRTRIALALALAMAVAIPAAALQVGANRKIYTMADEGVKPPKLLQKMEPGYSPSAREAKIEGAVLLSITVDEKGRTGDITVERSLHPELDENAIKSIFTWQFEPATRDGKPVAVRAKVEVNFRLL